MHKIFKWNSHVYTRHIRKVHMLWDLQGRIHQTNTRLGTLSYRPVTVPTTVQLCLWKTISQYSYLMERKSRKLPHIRNKNRTWRNIVMQAVVNKWVCGINKQIRLNAVSSWPLCISSAKSFLSCLAIACLLFLSSLSRHRARLIAFLLQISKAKTKTKGLHKLELVHVHDCQTT